ncbi:MAG: alpha/beta fold hydrolase [Rubrivivax sp.]|nr:alpha/beta fold hydrolase [Rubrivivax sp.]
MKTGSHPGQRHPPRGASGPPLVLLHGFLGTPAAWDAVLAALPDHGEVWCPWLPGHGPAPPGPGSFDEAAQWLADAVPAGAVLAGYSMGARLALAATLRRPGAARATLLVGGHVGLATPSERAERAALDARRAAALRDGDLAAFVDGWQAQPLFATQLALPAAAQAAQRAARMAHDPRALAWAFEVAGLAQMPDLRPALAVTRQRVCFTTGALDTRFGTLAAALVRPPWVDHRVVPDAGHNLLLEAPAAVAQLLRVLTGGAVNAPSQR